MASINKVILIGTMGRDPETRFLPSGEAVANVSIATNSKYKNKSGDLVEETEWHRVTFFGKLAEIVGQYLKKGRPVYVEGRIKTRKYTDKDGVEKYATDIIANEMQMLGERQDGGQESDRQQSDREQYSEPRQAPAQRPMPAPNARQATPRSNSNGFDPSFDDGSDIPF